MLCFALLTSTFFSYAQVPDTLWTKTFGGSNIDIGHSVWPTSDSGYVVTGYTRSYGSTGGRNVWLIKTDKNGNLMWYKTFGGNDDDEGYSVRQTIDGGYIIAGYTKSSGAGAKDVFMIKTDSLGNSQWIKTFGGSNDDEGYAVVQTTDGGYLAAGVTSSFAAGGRDVWLVKTDPSGNQLWTKSLGGTGSDGAWSVVQTTDGGFAIGGWTYSYGPGYMGNAWLVKTDANGNMLWHKFFGGSGVDRAYHVQQTSDGGFILTGYTSSSGAGLDDMLLIRTDTQGNLIWSKTFGGTGRDYGQAVIEITEDGGFLVAGYTLSYGMGSDDMYIVRTDSQGNLLWQKTLGGVNSDIAYSVKRTYDGHFIITGHTLSYGAGVHDVWLIKLASDITSSVIFPPESCRNILVCSPNPFSHKALISFNLPFDGFTRITLWNLNGCLIKTFQRNYMPAGTYTLEVDAKELSPGYYVCRLENQSIVESLKIIVLK